MRGKPNNKTREQKHNDLIKKYGRSKFKDSEDFFKSAGVMEGENPPIHYVSEKVLSKDWLTPEEDKAWHDL